MVALDLAEPFRLLIALPAFNRGEPCEGHFLPTASPCGLTDSGRKGFFSACVRRVDMEIGGTPGTSSRAQDQARSVRDRVH